ncbi:MAG: helix-turn-helix domain-containing protein [Sulfobacillus sp.]
MTGDWGRREQHAGHQYREEPSGSVLAPHFVCLWSQTVGDRSPIQHRILPDACVDIVFGATSPALVAGPATLPVLADLPAGSVLVGARFRPGSAPAWLGVAAHEMLNMDVPLRAIWGPSADLLSERMAKEMSAGARLALLRTELTARLAKVGRPDPLVEGAISALARPEAPSVGELSRQVFLSERQLRRRFRDAVGYGPKTLHRILRLQRLLLVAERGDQSLAQLAQAGGYTDQAHMTRDLGTLSGQTPQALLQWPGATLGLSDLFKATIGADR